MCKHRACVYHHCLPGFHGDCVALHLRYLRPRAPHDTSPGICYLTFQDRAKKKKGKSAERATRSDHERTVSPARGDPWREYVYWDFCDSWIARLSPRNGRIEGEKTSNRNRRIFKEDRVKRREQVTGGDEVRAEVDVACVFEESNEQRDSFLWGRRRDDMQLEHGPDRDDDSKIGRAVKETCSCRTDDVTCSVPRRPRLPSVLVATCFSRVPLVDRFEHPSSPVTSGDREVTWNARNEIDWSQEEETELKSQFHARYAYRYALIK